VETLNLFCFVFSCAKKKTKKQEHILYFFMKVAFLFVVLLCLSMMARRAECQTDSDIFRLLYDEVANVVTNGVTVDGTVTDVFLMQLPGLSIRREDFDADAWQAGQFRDRMPAAQVAALVDTVPRYNSLAFTDSGNRISKLWDHLLRQYVVPLDLDPATAALLEEARAKLENGTLAAEVDARLTAWRSELENNFALREACLAQRTPEVCAQLAVTWRERLRRSWFNLEVVKSELESAQSRVIGLQIKDLNNAFARALEVTEQHRRVDVGAVGYGEEFLSTYLTPSNWWQWWPLDVTAYDDVVDNRFNTTLVYSVTSNATVVRQANFGTATVDATAGTLTYVPDAGYIGADSFAYRDAGTVVQLRIAVNGDVLSRDSSAWTKVSLSQSEVQEASSSSFSILHNNNAFTVNSGAIRFFGSFDSTVNTQASYSFASGTFTIEFELARVQITRPWFDTSLLNFSPVGMRGVREHGWSDGNPLFTSDTSFAFDLLPTSMIVARNIRLESSQIERFSSTIQEVFASRSSSVRIGPFEAGGSTAAGLGNSRVHTAARIQSDGSLFIDGPQIIGFVCSALPAFPSGDAEEIDAANIEAYNKLQRAREFALAVMGGAPQLLSQNNTANAFLSSVDSQ
jgi:hypothetical protein